jgi:hypothetical protein
MESKPIPRPTALEREAESRGLSSSSRDTFSNSYIKSPDLANIIAEEFKEANIKVPGDDSRKLPPRRGLTQSMPIKTKRVRSNSTEIAGKPFNLETEHHVSWASLNGDAYSGILSHVGSDRIQFTQNGRFLKSFKVQDVQVIKVLLLPF